MALDPAYFFYSDGTITLTNGSDIATGDMVAWDVAVLPFDLIFPNDGTGGATVIKEVLAYNQIRLAKPWAGPTLTDVPYFILRWVRHTDPKVYALRVADYLTRLKAIPDNIDQVADQITADREAVDAAMITLQQIESDVESDRQAVAADRLVSESAASAAAASADEAEAWAQAASSGVLPDNSVTNTKLADMATGTLKGRSAAGTGDPQDLTAAQVAALLAEYVVPPGAVAAFARPTAPGGWFKANGAAVNRTTYQALDTAIYVGDALNATAEWGYRCTDPANPSTTRSTTGGYIVLPDLRAEFLRGWDDSRGVDAGRIFGSKQAHRTEDLYAQIALRGASPQITNGRVNIPNYTTSHTLSGISNAAVQAMTENLGTAVGSFGTGETRPRNVALLFCIKY